MYRYDQLRHLHLEPTTRCNAACPMCARNSRGAPAPLLPRAELTGDSVRAMFPADFLAPLTRIDLCGAYGDPALADDLLDVAAYLRSASSHSEIHLFTNGGVRSTSWWQRLARAAGPALVVIFAIDGLADTNGIYRRGVDFGKVMANAAAFISAGGAARWEFIVFRHNEHQVEQARVRSEEMGFASFTSKRTGRFIDAAFDYVPETAGQQDISSFPVYSATGEIVDRLYPPRDSKWTREAADAASEKAGTWLLPVLDRTPIACRAQTAKGLFVSAAGHAFPCPWTYVQATRPAQSRFPEGVNRQVRSLLEACGGFDAIHVPTVGLRGAVESEFFAAVSASWSIPSIAQGRLQICGRTCGTEVQDFVAELDDHKQPLPAGS